MNEKYLPIGTVCRLKDGNKNLMIVGFCQASTENESVIYDYNGCMYPEGIFAPDINFLFNHDQIEEIIYMGLVNEEEKSFKSRLKEFLMTGKIDGKEINVDENGNVSLIGNENNNVDNSLENSPIETKIVTSDTLTEIQTQIPQQNNKIETTEVQTQTVQSTNVENDSVVLFNTLPNMSGNNE